MKYFHIPFYLKLEIKINSFNLVLQIPKMNWWITMIGKHLTINYKKPWNEYQRIPRRWNVLLKLGEFQFESSSRIRSKQFNRAKLKSTEEHESPCIESDRMSSDVFRSEKSNLQGKCRDYTLACDNREWEQINKRFLRVLLAPNVSRLNLKKYSKPKRVDGENSFWKTIIISSPWI